MRFRYVKRDTSTRRVNALRDIEGYGEASGSLERHRRAGVVQRRRRVWMRRRFRIGRHWRCIQNIDILVPNVRCVVEILLSFINTKEPFRCHR